MDLNLTPTKQHPHNSTENISIEEIYEVVDKMDNQTPCQSSHLPLDKFDAIINSMKNIENVVLSINSNFEKLLAIFTLSNANGSLKVENVSKTKEDLEKILLEKSVDPGSLKDDKMDDQTPCQSSPPKKSCSSPFINYYPTNQSASTKLDVSSENNVKTPTNGPPELPSEIINFQYTEHRFPSQLVTLKEIPIKKDKGTKLASSQKKNNKDSHKEHNVKSNVGHQSPDDVAHPSPNDDLKSKNMRSKKKAQTLKKTTLVESTTCYNEEDVSGSVVKSVIKEEEKRENIKCNDDIDFSMQDILVQAQSKLSKKRKAKHEIGDTLSKIVRENDYIPDTYKTYLSFLTPDERAICDGIANWKKKTNTCYEKASNIAEVTDVVCIFPGKWLKSTFIDIYLYDLHFNQEAMPKKLILPVAFQYRVIEIYLDTNRRSKSSSILKYHDRWIEAFMPTDSSKVEQVYVPLNDEIGRHWFLLVINVVERKNYILDSLGVDQNRRKIVSELLFKTPHIYGNHPHLGRLFEESANFLLEIYTTPLQPNEIDCGMYVLKYIEADRNSDWSKISFSTESMGIERLKYLAKLITSKHNEATLFKRAISGDTSIDLEQLS